MNKQEILTRIEGLPLFEKRDVQTRNGTDKTLSEWTPQEQQAVCRIGDNKAFSFVHKGYNLLQFKDIFKPLVESFDSEIEAYLCNYGGYCILKVFPDDENLKNETGHFGIIAINSVDLSSAIVVKFCVKHNERQFSIPTKIAGLKKQHTGKAPYVVQNYISMISKVKDAWGNIIEEFPKYKIVIDLEKTTEEKAIELGTIVDKLKIGKNLTKKIKKEYEERVGEGKYYTLWDLFIKVIDSISDKTYTSDVHKERKIDTICQSVFEYAMLLGL